MSRDNEIHNYEERNVLYGRFIELVKGREIENIEDCKLLLAGDRATREVLKISEKVKSQYKDFVNTHTDLRDGSPEYDGVEKILGKIDLFERFIEDVLRVIRGKIERYGYEAGEDKIPSKENVLEFCKENPYLLSDINSAYPPILDNRLAEVIWDFPIGYPAISLIFNEPTMGDDGNVSVETRIRVGPLAEIPKD